MLPRHDGHPASIALSGASRIRLRLLKCYAHDNEEAGRQLKERHTPGHQDCPVCERRRLVHALSGFAPSLSFSEAAKLWLEERALNISSLHGRARYMAPATVNSYRQYIESLARFFGEIPLEKIHIGHVREYQAQRIERAAPLKVNQELSLLLRIRKLASVTDNLQELYQPLQLPGFRPRRAMTAQEEQRFFAVAQSRPEWLFVYWYSVLSLNTTASGCELRGLHLADVDLAGRILYVRRGSAKNHYRIRPIPLVPLGYRAACWLIGRARELGATDPDHYLLPFRVSPLCFDPLRPMSNSGIKRGWNAMRTAAGLPWLRPHDLRHLAITKLAESGASDMVIMSIAGHVTRQMLEHYSQVRMEAKRSAIENAMSGEWRRPPAAAASIERRTVAPRRASGR